MRKVIINSLPKSGTNLVAKALKLMGYHEQGGIGSFLISNNTFKARVRQFLWSNPKHSYVVGVDSPVLLPIAPINRMLDRVGDGGFLSAHLGYNNDLLIAAKSRGFLPLLVTRDPRAVLSSFVAYVLKYKQHQFHSHFVKLDAFARYDAALFGRTFNTGTLASLKERCFSLQPWASDIDVLRVRFEDIIGAKGGGDDLVQECLLKDLCASLKVPEEKIDSVAENLFGPGRKTFRKGQIDSWKQEVPMGIQEQMHAELEDILKSWGYIA